MRASVSEQGSTVADGMRRVGVVLLGLCGAMALSACGGPIQSIMESGDQATGLSQDIMNAAGVASESARDLGASDQAQYFVAWKDDDSLNTGDQRPYLIAVQGDDDEFSVGWRQITENLLVR